MRTQFSPAQLSRPALAAAERQVRACVHCGICTATCPTYVLTGDERDGPRGRIVMMQQMLEEGGAPSPEAVHHVDRCLSCLSCRAHCPSSVDYARLVDAARVHIETHRPLGERLFRAAIAFVMTRPALVRLGLRLAPLGRMLPGRLGALARMGVKTRPHAVAPEPLAATGTRRIALMPGCVQQALAPEIDLAVQRVSARRGIVLVRLDGAGCCGALVHHLGRDARDWAKRAIEAFERSGCESVLVTATGCSAHLKDLAHLFADDPAWEPRARAFAGKAVDFVELATPAAPGRRKLRVAWQAPCSLQNGLRLADKGRALLAASGFDVADVPEGHLCCGSAGSYAILQPEMAAALRARKLGNIGAVEAIATANIGCLHHLSGPDAPPVFHLAELIDWAETEG